MTGVVELSPFLPMAVIIVFAWINNLTVCASCQFLVDGLTTFLKVIVFSLSDFYDNCYQT